jgi:hypothetical protein
VVVKPFFAELRSSHHPSITILWSFDIVPTLLSSKCAPEAQVRLPCKIFAPAFASSAAELPTAGREFCGLSDMACIPGKSANLLRPEAGRADHACCRNRFWFVAKGCIDSRLARESMINIRRVAPLRGVRMQRNGSHAVFLRTAIRTCASVSPGGFHGGGSKVWIIEYQKFSTISLYLGEQCKPASFHQD